jgi:hypothetical protein
MTDTTWLEAAGLVHLDGCTYRASRKKMQVRVYNYPDRTDVWIMDELLGRTWLTLSAKRNERMQIKTGLEALSPEQADRFATALHLAARLARAFNERSR